MSIKLDHTVIVSTDTERAAQRFAEIMGATPASQGTLSGRKPSYPSRSN